jgi:diacylglycerol kinase family enzyme
MNPCSRGGRGRRLWRVWEQGLRAAAATFRAVTTERPGHARELARNARDGETVVAVGGDGTINEVLDGILQSEEATRAMGVLYCGTSPDFCRFHGIPLNPDAALVALIRGESRPVDVGRIAYRGPDGEEATAHFGCSVNVGMGASIARTANRWRRRLGDAPGTALGACGAILRNRRVDLELTVDGERLLLAATNNLSVVKNPHLASGLKLGLDLAPDDGRLWLAGIAGYGRIGLCRLLPGFYSGRVTARPGLLLRPCRTVVIRSAQEQEIEFDGDPRGALPCRIELLPRALRLVGGIHDRV